MTFNVPSVGAELYKEHIYIYIFIARLFSLQFDAANHKEHAHPDFKSSGSCLVCSKVVASDIIYNSALDILNIHLTYGKVTVSLCNK